MKRILLPAAVAAAALLFAPGPARAAHGEYCREYAKSVRVGGEVKSAYGTACLQPDGSWRLVSFGGHDDLRRDIRRDVRNDRHSAVRNVAIIREPPRTAYRPYFFFSYSDGHGHRERHRRHYRHCRH